MREDWKEGGSRPEGRRRDLAILNGEDRDVGATFDLDPPVPLHYVLSPCRCDARDDREPSTEN